MLRKLKTFVTLPAEDKKLFFEAYFTLGMMRMAVLTLPFKRLTSSLHHEVKKTSLDKLNDEELKTAKQVGRAIVRASAYTPWNSNCLAQSLTAYRMLHKRGVPGVFYLGTMKNKEDGQMKAHAWTQCGEIIITGKPGHEQYTILSVFGWRKA